MDFERLGIADDLLRALRESGYTAPTPIQEQAIPPALEGADVFGCAKTGTGKTAAFVLPILQRLAAGRPEPRRRGPRPIRALILTPTRELAAQIGESIATYGAHLPLRRHVIHGGVGQGPQVAALRRGIDLLVACPGRLLDLMDQGRVDLRGVECLVLDEADRMLDMGFIRDVRRIIGELPARRQTLFFSATVPAEVRTLADDLLVDPVDVRVAETCSTAENVDQTLYLVTRQRKLALLEHLLDDELMVRALVFTRTKRGADRVAERLTRGRVRAEAIHGDKSQGARTRALEAFRSGKVRVLVASDLASRGIDVDSISHVINFELPHEPETYVHRIGRTGRAGRKGKAISFCDHDERSRLRGIQRLIECQIEVVENHPYAAGDRREADPDRAASRRDGARPRRAGADRPRAGNSHGARRPRRRGPRR